MIQSLLIKLSMLAGTIAVILWIGWTVPAIPDQRTTVAPMTSVATPTPPSHESVVAQAAATHLPSRKSLGREELRHASGRLDINRGTVADFESLPGIGPVLAKRIVEYRLANGVFRTVDELRQVKGIGAKKFEKIRPLLHVTSAVKPVKGGHEAA